MLDTSSFSNKKKFNSLRPDTQIQKLLVFSLINRVSDAAKWEQLKGQQCHSWRCHIVPCCPSSPSCEFWLANTAANASLISRKCRHYEIWQYGSFIVSGMVVEYKLWRDKQDHISPAEYDNTGMWQSEVLLNVTLLQLVKVFMGRQYGQATHFTQSDAHVHRCAFSKLIMHT